ncbi:nuclear transport factor 2 family protein [Caldalkalibacillus mannanilyticus]|uniref:nuclear transport factor 2 family protein n=1 Tax=Caldalkalibacillus mannanilyticus TaxID=1418 RepID=UPI00046B0127|nr:nuclear transport factor 2 family protein [Caldalkalibacillus mannanilyticus]
MSSNKTFFQQFNEAFAKGDINFIIEHVTEDIQWTMVGEPPIKGKVEFSKALETMANGETHELTISNIITDEHTVAVDGIFTMVSQSGDAKRYAFCDVYLLDTLENEKIKQMTSYVITLETNG